MDEFRVGKWSEFIGQGNMKDRLGIHLTAARTQARVLDHVLLAGPTGFGKTSLANIIGAELERPLLILEMPITVKRLETLCRDHPKALVLMDEIHSAPKAIQEALLPLLEFGWVQTTGGLKVRAEGMTVIGATTEKEKLIKPLLDRFGIQPVFDDYTDAEMGAIVRGMAAKAGLNFPVDTAEALGRATGGTPRRARSFVLAARDLICTRVPGVDTYPTANEILDHCRVDATGMTVQHREYLAALEDTGGRAGLATLKNILRMSEPELRDLELMLFKQGLVRFTGQGRELTGEGQMRLESTTV